MELYHITIHGTITNLKYIDNLNNHKSTKIENSPVILKMLRTTSDSMKSTVTALKVCLRIPTLSPLTTSALRIPVFQPKM